MVATTLQDGYAQVSPRGSTMVYDDEHLALWERGRGSTTENLRDGSKVLVFVCKPQLRTDGVLPKGGIARFYGMATIHEERPVYEEVCVAVSSCIAHKARISASRSDICLS